MDTRLSRLAPALIAAAILLPVMLLTVYVAGYFWLGKVNVYQSSLNRTSSRPFPGSTIGMFRDFKRQWHADFYGPAGEVESFVRGVDVPLLSDEEIMGN